MWQVRGRRDMHTGFDGRNLQETGYLEDLGVEEGNI
jgi:hypothetical protein